MATVAEQLVGRATEIGAVEHAVERLGEGEQGALVFLGEPGIGKTRMLAELEARAEAVGQIVLSGSGSELESDLPFWVFVDALDEYVAGLDPRKLESLDDGVKDELGQLFPSLAYFAGAGGDAVPAQDGRYRAHRAARELLERVAATKPLVLLLDDVHWADPASIELLGALLRRPPAAAVLFALGARPRQLPSRLAAALERAARAGTVTRIELGALGEEDAGVLLGQEMDRVVADRLYRESGGNPFYLEQLSRSVQRGGSVQAPAGDVALRGADVPAAVASALTEELELLGAGARRLLDGAAVAGDPFEPDLAAAAAATDETTAVEALDELLLADLVRRTEVPRRFRFRHPLVRTVVYETAPGGWVLGAHERCADALAQRGASPSARAHHVEHAARPGDHAAIELLRAAGAETMLRAPASSARWFGAALRLLPDGVPPEERVGLLVALSTALATSGQLEQARATLLETLELIPADAVETWVQLTVACAGVEHFLGRHDLARKRLAEALARLPEPNSAEGVALMLELAVDGMFSADYASARQWGSRALAAARPLGDTSLIALTGGMVALGSACTGAIDEAEALRSEVAGLIDGMSDAELARRPDAAGYLGAAELQLARFADAIAHTQRGLEIARATGQMAPTLVPTLGTARFMHGQLEESASVLDIGLEMARVGGIAQSIAWSLVNRSMAAFASGDLNLALSAAEEAVELTQQLDERFISSWAGVAHARALLEAGEPARAAETLLRESGGEELRTVPDGWKPLGFELLARARLELGDREQAAAVAQRAAAVAEKVDLAMTAAWADRAAAAVALEAGQAATAAELALSAASHADCAAAPVEAAISRLLAGRALAAADNRDRAVEELERAAASLEGCGATRWRDAAERELRKLGRAVHRRTRKSAGGDGLLAELSERELEVARLVIDRKTNREIAGELFLSMKTVEAHMRNLFRKLGVSSRVDVARTVERAERNQGSE